MSRIAPKQMFDLVADVERYPQFLPLCEALTVRSRKERDGQTMLVADMTVGYKAIRETFTSQVHLKPDEHGDRRQISRRAVPLPQQCLALRAGRRRRLAWSTSSSTTSSRAAFSAR